MIRTTINKKQEARINALQVRWNQLTSMAARAGLAERLNTQTFDGDRHMYEALGYPLKLSFNDYMARYSRQDIASAIIDRPVEATWKGLAEIVESDDDKKTALEQAWIDLWHDMKLKTMFSRLDKLTGIGRYGVLLLGTSDLTSQEAWAQPIGQKVKLMYLKPFSEQGAQIQTYETDASNERFGKPLTYTIEITETAAGASKSIVVHYSRLIHVVDDILESDIEGTPRLQKVFNRLIDLEKIVGGSAEMFWKGARPGYQGIVKEGYKMTTSMMETLDDQLDEYEHNLRRILVNEGIEYKALAIQVEDPSNHVDIQIQMISAQTAMPKRILTGSERGELSSSQDKTQWDSFIQNRRDNYAEPSILRLFIDKMVDIGILPKSKERYTIKWDDLFELTNKEKAEVGKTRAESLRAYAGNPAIEAVIPPKAFLRYFVGLSEDEVLLIEQMQEDAMDDERLLSPQEAEILKDEELGIEPIGKKKEVKADPVIPKRTNITATK